MHHLYLLLFVCMTHFCSAQEWQWFWQFDESNVEFSGHIAHDNDGNCISTGRFNSEPLIAGDDTLNMYTSMNYYIVKHDSLGNIEWATQAKTKTEPFGLVGDLYDVECDKEGNIYIAGTYIDTISFGDTPQGCLLSSAGAPSNVTHAFIVKLNPDGTCAWLKNGDSNAYTWANDIDIDDEGFVYVAGSFRNEIDFGDISMTSSTINNFTSSYIMKLDQDGNSLWIQEVVTPGNNAFMSGLDVDKEGNIYIAAGVQEFVELDGITLTSDFRTNTLLAKLGTNGSYLWHHFISCTDDSSNGSITVTDIESVEDKLAFAGHWSNDDLLIGGDSYDAPIGKRNFVGLLDENGEGWSLEVGETSGSWVMHPDIAIDANDGIHFISNFDNTAEIQGTELIANGGTDIILADFDLEGNVTWLQNYGGFGLDFSYGVSVDRFGSAFITGDFRNNITIEENTYTSQGSVDAFVGRIFYANTLSSNTNPTARIAYTIWPNPTSENMHLKCNVPILQTQIFNLAGTLIQSYTGLPSKIEVSDWTAGNYWAVLKDIDNNLFHIEFVVQH